MHYYPQVRLMKGFLLLLLCCLTTWGAAAQNALDGRQALDFDALEFSRRVVFPAVALFMLGSFIIAAIKLVLNYLLKNKIIEAAVLSEQVVERLLPGRQDEQSKVIKWVALLLSTGTGLALCNWFLPLGLHSIVILLFSTAFGFLGYYFFLRRQSK
jgi:hypothetical protein